MDNKPPAGIRLQRSVTRAAIRAHFKKTNAASKKKVSHRILESQKANETLVMKTLDLIIMPQINSGSWHLNLNDKIMEESLGVTPRQAKALRRLMKTMGLIYFPEKTRQKKKGDYPHWLLKYDFITMPPLTPKKKRVVKVKSYQPIFYTYQKQAYKNINDYLSLFPRDERPSSVSFFVMVNGELNQLLAAAGLSREALRLK